MQMLRYYTIRIQIKHYMAEIKYTYTERMAFELGLQSAKTAIRNCDWLHPDLKDKAIEAIEQRANETLPEMRVLEPARKNPKNLN